eukprot:5913198-Pyramimonas_sp.AAC.1
MVFPLQRRPHSRASVIQTCAHVLATFPRLWFAHGIQSRPLRAGTVAEDMDRHSGQALLLS